jgi:cell division protein ZapA|tara:strand:+ start:327 stop:599 length:273 start_codon:yes stop_codon:yes gene_type:complete
MADVEISINNRSYRISCKDGEEDRIRGLATLLNKQIIQLAEKIGQLGEARMILLASLILLDKSDETEKESEKILNIATEKIEELAKNFTE